MPVMSGFGALAELPWERVTDKIERRVLAGQQGMIVWWKMKAGAHAAAHRHPHEQIVWMLKGKMDFRIGNDRKSMVSGDVATIDIFAPKQRITFCLFGSVSGRLLGRRALGDARSRSSRSRASSVGCCLRCKLGLLRSKNRHLVAHAKLSTCVTLVALAIGAVTPSLVAGHLKWWASACRCG